jgi:hypothetical protein
MDAFMTASGSKGYFLISQNKATMYSDIALWQSEMVAGAVVGKAPLSTLDTAAKRAKYPPVFDVAYHEDFNREFWFKDYLQEGRYGYCPDHNGNVVIYFPDRTEVMTMSEYQDFKEKEHQAFWDNVEANRQAEYDRLIAERDAELAERRESSTARQHRHRNPDGTYGPWEEGPYDG